MPTVISGGASSLGSSISAAEIETDAVTTVKIQDAAVTSDKTAETLWTLLDETVLGAEADTVTWTSVPDCAAYMIIINAEGTTNSGATKLYINDVTTATDYYTELVTQEEGSMSPSLQNASICGSTSNGKGSLTNAILGVDLNGYLQANVQCSRFGGEPNELLWGTVSSKNAIGGPITKIELYDAGDAWVAGSTFQLWGPK